MQTPDFSKMTYAEVEAYRGKRTDMFAQWDHFSRFLRTIADATEARVLTPEQAHRVLEAYPHPY